MVVKQRRTDTACRKQTRKPSAAAQVYRDWSRVCRVSSAHREGMLNQPEINLEGKEKQNYITTNYKIIKEPPLHG